MVCAWMMHKKNTSKGCDRRDNNNNTHWFGTHILQKKARQSVAPSEDFNNLTSTPGDIGNQEACEMNEVENCVDQNQMLDPNASSQKVECQEKFDVKILSQPK